MKEIITTIKIDDNGNVIGTSTETKVIEEKKEKECSRYTVIFDERSPLWTKDREFNIYTLRYQERYANDKLRAKGYLFLNDVLEMLGLPRTKIGQLVGWIYNGEIKNYNNFVEFEVFPCNGGKDGIIVNFLGYKNILNLI